jgi:hypothetical protein
MAKLNINYLFLDEFDLLLRNPEAQVSLYDALRAMKVILHLCAHQSLTQYLGKDQQTITLWTASSSHNWSFQHSLLFKGESVPIQHC